MLERTPTPWIGLAPESATPASAVLGVPGAVIDPVVFPTTAVCDGRSPIAAATHRTLPLPTAPTPRTTTAVYGMAAVDCRGRVADRAVLAALGWMA